MKVIMTCRRDLGRCRSQRGDRVRFDLGRTTRALDLIGFDLAVFVAAWRE